MDLDIIICGLDTGSSSTYIGHFVVSSVAVIDLFFFM